MAVLDTLSAAAWSPAVILCFAAAGAYCTFRIGFLQFRPRLWIPRLFSRGGGQGIPPWKAAVTAMGGALGTGNISGVAWAVALGGPGAVFWMWISALTGMALSYCEKALSVAGRRHTGSDGPGGAVRYIGRALGPVWGRVYAVLCAAGAFTGGCMVQCSAISGSLRAAAGPGRWTVGLCLCLLTFCVIRGGLKRTASVSAVLVPAASAAYIIVCAAALFAFRERIFPVFREIFSSAFRLKSAVVGGVFSSPMRRGFSRGVFSSEAGTGMSSLLHGESSAADPSDQGAWGIFEVFFDTIVICTLTALTVLCSPVGLDRAEGEGLTIAALSAFMGGLAPGFVSAVVFILAFSTVISRHWCLRRCVLHLGAGEKTAACFSAAFCLACLAGSALPSLWVWELSDILTVLMALPNLVSVCLLCPRIARSNGPNSKKISKK